jgi:hypothetical protein
MLLFTRNWLQSAGGEYRMSSIICVVKTKPVSTKDIVPIDPVGSSEMRVTTPAQVA